MEQFPVSLPEQIQQRPRPPRGKLALVLLGNAAKQAGQKGQRQSAGGQCSQLPLDSLFLVPDLPKSLLPRLSLFPVLSAAGRKTPLRLADRCQGPVALGFQCGGLLADGGKLRVMDLNLRFQFGDLARLLVRADLAEEARFHGRGVGDQPLGQVEPQQRFDGGAEDRAATLVLGQETDFLGVEEEQLRDAQRHQFLDHLVPVVRKPAVADAIAGDVQFLGHFLPAEAPGAADLVQVLLPFGGKAEAEGQRSAFLRFNSVVDALAEELLVAQAAAFGTECPRTVQGELDRVQDGRFAAAVDAAEKDDGRPLAVPPLRRKVERLFAPVQAEIPER